MEPDGKEKPQGAFICTRHKVLFPNTMKGCPVPGCDAELKHKSWMNPDADWKLQAEAIAVAEISGYPHEPKDLEPMRISFIGNTVRSLHTTTAAEFGRCGYGKEHDIVRSQGRYYEVVGNDHKRGLVLLELINPSREMRALHDK